MHQGSIIEMEVSQEGERFYADIPHYEVQLGAAARLNLDGVRRCGLTSG